MPKSTTSPGTVHKLPTDLHTAIAADQDVHDRWESLTPLARNEWICWTISVKREETRKEHISRLCQELKDGQRRPCCWYGCIHRTDKAVSPSVQNLMIEKKRKRTNS